MLLMCLERPLTSALMPDWLNSFFNCDGDILLAVYAALIQQFGGFLVELRLQIAQREIFQFPLDLPHAQSVCQRREYALGLARNDLLIFLACPRQVAHGLGALGKFDQHDADILHHRQQHFAQAFYLLRVITLVFFRLVQALHLAEVLDLLHARHAQHQAADVYTHRSVQLFRPVFQVFRHGMQDGGSHRFVIHVHAGQNRGSAQRVLHQRHAGYFGITGVKRPGKITGMSYRGHFGGREVFRQ
jgi:hypothetical protein